LAVPVPKRMKKIRLRSIPQNVPLLRRVLFYL
jgi:hypothetical protein